MKATRDNRYVEKILRAAARAHDDDYYRERNLIHVSELIRCLRQSYYRRTIGVPAGEQASEDLTLMLGSAFGAWLEPEAEEVLRLDGIIGRPDITEWDEEALASELKSTRSSSNKTLTGKDGMGDYLDQVSSYALMKGMRKARLTILHMMGDYREQRKPVMISWVLEWSQDEIDSARVRMYDRRDELQAALDNGAPPDTSKRLPWACKYCPFFKRICYPTDRAAWGANFKLDEPDDDAGLDLAPEGDITSGGS